MGIESQGVKQNRRGKQYHIDLPGHYGTVDSLEQEFLASFDDSHLNDLQFDYAGFLKKFYQKRVKGKNHEEAFHSVVSKLFKDAVPCLFDLLHLKYWSLPDFFNGNIDVLSDEEYIDTEEFDGVNSEEFLKQRRNNLFSWLKFGGDYGHPALFPPNSLSVESFVLLFGESQPNRNSLFERSLREGNIYDLHKERKIALMYLLSNGGIDTSERTFSDEHIKSHIERSIASLRKSLSFM